MASDPVSAIYRGGRTSVDRVHTSTQAQATIRKRASGPHAEARIRNERSILHRLAGVAGVPRLRDGERGPLELVTGDTGGETVAGQPVPDLGSFALRLTVVLGAVHAAGVIHRDVNPSNILIHGDGGVTLIDFDIATIFAEVRPGFTHHREILGSLPYLAPEQTGRTGQAVDRRSDLYGLGATLYELATGRPPFGDGDALDLIRDLLTTAPAPVSSLAPHLPPGLDAVIMRLLEKDPDRRYQSATGLAYDLEKIVAGESAELVLGRHGYPDRLTAPSALVGREVEIAELRAALDGVAGSAARGVLIAGAGGVGKSALIGQLAPMLAARRGWLLRAKHDQFRADAPQSGVLQALRGLGRFLLAEPDDILAQHRTRLLARLGPNAARAAALLPELATLLETDREATVTAGEAGNVAGDAARVRRIALDVLRAVADPDRPIALILDDLQWATEQALRLADAVITDPDLRGVLVVCACRDREVDAAHPYSAMRDRWRRLGALSADVLLDNLDRTGQASLLAEILRLPADDAARLAGVLAELCDGNPYDMIELVNALRQDGALRLDTGGWRWSETEIRHYVGPRDVKGLLSVRIGRLPEATRAHLATMACLGNEVGLELLACATAREPAVLSDELAAAFDDGLLVMDDGRESVRFRHDRVQQAAFEGSSISGYRLSVARRLAPTFGSDAAEQYQHALDDITDPAEQRQVAELFEAAAAQAVRVADFAGAERFLSHAIGLRGPTFETQVARHLALFHLGRLTDADAVYDWIISRARPPMDLVGPACVQIAGLTNRLRPRDALDLGLDLLARMGRPRPIDPLAVVRNRLDAIGDWIATADVDRDANRPELTDPVQHHIGQLINSLAAPAFFCDHQIMMWLVTEAYGLWQTASPDAALVPPLAFAAYPSIALRGDYRTGPRIIRHVRRVAEQRGWAHAAAHARFLDAISGRHWHESLDDTPAEAAAACEGLLLSGNPQPAASSYVPLVVGELETAPSLDRVSVALDAGLMLADRTGNMTSRTRLLTFRRLVHALQNDSADPDDPPAAGDEIALGFTHLTRAVAAAILGDAEALSRAVTAYVPKMPTMEVGYATALARFLQVLDGTVTEERRVAAERWLGDRAGESPANFGHLHQFARAENARTRGDHTAALRAYDAGLTELDHRSRPWHRALMLERAASLHAAAGLDRGRRTLLAEAHAAYLAWGATAKVRRLELEHPHLRGHRCEAATGRRTTTSITTDDLDLMAVLRASQAISSETSLERLHAAAVDQLRVLTGADRISLLLSDEDHQWRLLPQPGPFPATVVRYVDRTGESLVVADAVRDDRFRDDPYLTEVPLCALMAVPLITQGSGKAMLVLENRLHAGAFAGDRLDAVTLVAGQLAVSVNNAVLYRTLEQRVADRTAELHTANEKLTALSATDELTGLPNRRRFSHALDSADSTSAVAMIDLDNFKKFNDRYGHPAGDDCLRRVAQAMNAATREVDVVCRYGGEEFVMILPATSAELAAEVGERVRAAVAALAIPHAGNPGGVVTISVGIAAADSPGSAAELVELADTALYEAKENGRNRVHTVALSRG